MRRGTCILANSGNGDCSPSSSLAFAPSEFKFPFALDRPHLSERGERAPRPAPEGPQSVWDTIASALALPPCRPACKQGAPRHQFETLEKHNPSSPPPDDAAISPQRACEAAQTPNERAHLCYQHHQAQKFTSHSTPLSRSRLYALPNRLTFMRACWALQQAKRIGPTPNEEP